MKLQLESWFEREGRSLLLSTCIGLVALTSVACGTRVERRPEGALAAPSSAASAEPASAPFDGSTAKAASEVSPVPGGQPLSSRPVTSPAAAAGSHGSGGVRSNGATVTTASAGAAQAGRETGGKAPAPNPGSGQSTNPGSKPAPTPAPAGPAGITARSPLLLATVGSYSGVVGSVEIQYLRGAQVWVAHVNRRGGLNGHEVKLAVYDDGVDPARHRAQVQDAIEQKKVVAFLVNGEALTGQSSVEYINSKRVPVVGTDGPGGWANTSPMYFPQLSAGTAFVRSAVLSAGQQLASAGKKRMGSLVCVEGQACNEVDSTMAAAVKPAGFEQVYRGRASVTQPDYTAECLAARNANVEALVIGMDQNSVSRVGQACARQGFRPIYGFFSATAGNELRNDPNLQGAVSNSLVFPYFQSGTPATDEYQSARNELGKGFPNSVGLASGWVGGKLLERAAANLPEPPTSAAILAGLWSIKGDNLGGLTYPLTFVENQPVVAKTCWFHMTIKNETWISPDNSALHCEG